MEEKMRTPGVYIVERDAFPNSVVEVATAVPAFVGYTETAGTLQQNELLNIPRRVTSMAEFRKSFGGAPAIRFAITDKKSKDTLDDPVMTQAGNAYYLTREDQPYHLYLSMLHFFQNGGGPCFIVSVGTYNDSIKEKELIDGIATLVNEQEPTLVVVPDAVLLEEKSCANVQVQCLAHCRETQSRFAILDVYNGWRDREDTDADCIDAFREKIGTNDLQYGAAYYPWVETTVVQDSDIDFENIDEGSRKTLQKIICNGVADDETESLNIVEMSGGLFGDLSDEQKALLHKSLFQFSSSYKTIVQGIQKRVNLLPPSAAMAGIYTMVDNTRGVWKAPANVSLNGVIRPAVKISHEQQEDLNVHVQGKSINAIRSFVGEGTLVWGSRTLDGNSLDWRYINVRRTLIMLEQSLKLAANAYVFESNDANTWITIKSMTVNFLTGIWKRGGLAGASPEDAFSVHVGLGSTMTPEDILEGVLRITVLVALVRPAEFIEITFQQHMQKA